MLGKLFSRSRRHLAAAEESYAEHFVFASRTSGELLLIGLRLFVHGLVPCWFEFGASDRIKRLNTRLQQRAQMTRPTSVRDADTTPHLFRAGTE
jgi:hypothetical protein